VAYIARRFYNDREPARVYRRPRMTFPGPRRPDYSTPPASPTPSRHQMTTPCSMPWTQAHGGRGTPAT
jgi:hypothetical protein